ncbi:MAG: sensor histidine kinase, partial [Rhodoferax sp.]
LYCRADEGKLRQIILNVLSNAYKYSSQQGGDVLIRPAAPVLAESGPLVGIVIEDHGMGMQPEQVERVFERFYRADKSGAIPGTGLGMSIVKELIELLHGKINIDSTPGAGTVVTLYFPALPQGAAKDCTSTRQS